MSPVRVRVLAFGLLALVVMAGLSVAAPHVGASSVSAPSSCLLPDASPDGRDAVVRDTKGTLRPYVAARISSVGCQWPNDVRAIVLDRHEVRLQAAGRIVRRIGRSGVDSEPLAVHALVDLIGEPTWIRRDGRIVTVAAAIVQKSGTELSFGSGVVDEVRLLDLPYVGIVGTDAIASFDDVTVVSWSAGADGPVAGHGRMRPFVQYDFGSRVEITDSLFAWLGSASSGATGVTLSGHSGGTVVSTAFSNNYVGAMASEPEELIFMFNTMRDNVTDGVLVTAGDQGTTLDSNTMQGNGRDGIALTNVTDSVIRNNHVWGNNRHGIVLGAGVAATSVVDNVIEPNGVDGIVLEGATGSRVAGNVIGAHRSGIRLAEKATTGNVVSRNLISGSPIGVQISTDSAENVVVENEISGAALAEILTSVPSAPAAAAVPSADARSTAAQSPDVERQLLLGIGLFTAFGAVCGVSAGFARLLASRQRSGMFVDLGRRVTPTGKADYARTSDH